MAQQNEGWPLGLEPVNARIELVRNSENAGSISFNTLLTASPSSSTDSSSDLDTQSTGSFFPDKSTTLGSLMGVSSIVELSRRSLGGTKTEVFKSEKKKFNFSSWLFCLCSRSRDPEADNPPSLGQFLAVERRAANENRRSLSLPIYNPHNERNSLFMNGTIAPSHSINPRHDNKGFGSLAMLFSCMCGQDAFS